MDLDNGINAVRNARWSKWWAEARSLANASTPPPLMDAESVPIKRPNELDRATIEELTGGPIADEFLTLLSGSRAYIILMDSAYKILAASQSFRESRISEDDPTGSSFFQFLDADSQFKARAFLETMPDCPCVIDLTHWTPTEVPRRVNYCFCRSGDLGRTRVIAVGRDQEDPFELVEQLVRIHTEFEESRHGASADETTDALTGLGNRRWLFERMNALWREAGRQETLVWVMMADLDHFKKINQTFGNETGDELLKAIANKLHNSVRAGDWVCRYGGDGFLLAGLCSDESEMPGLAGRILSAIRGLRFDLAGKSPRITISLGAALAYPREPCQPWLVLQAADRAIHRAKEAGRDRYDVEPGVVGRPEGFCPKPSPRFR